MKLRLVVIKTRDPKFTAEFYSLFGIEFLYHKHGKSPYHYSGLIEDTTFEIYPLPDDKDADSNFRVGFAVGNFDEVLEKIRNWNGAPLSGPIETEWGTIAITQDPDGRKVEIYKE